MIPKLTQIPQQHEIVKTYLNELVAQGFEGDISSSFSQRLTLATDNSVYQMLPQAIIFPKNLADVIRLTKLAQWKAYQSLTFTPRGGGTGTNGQALNHNIIVDLSRHMTQILELNVEERWVRVQAGVVKDQLNQFLKPHGLFFAPELSTANRATLGGMINTDASGQGSVRYGKTSTHVLELTSVLMTGEVLKTQAIDIESLDPQHFSQQLAQLPLSEHSKRLHQQVFERCAMLREQVVRDLPQLNRFLTGYDLKNVFNEGVSQFNLSRILTGSEGSLAFVCEAKLNLLPLPEHRVLVNVKYQTFEAALRHAPFMLKQQALSVETIDSKVLNLAKQDIIWHGIQELLTETQEQPILGLNIVEFAGQDSVQIKQQVAQLCQQLESEMRPLQSGVIGYQVCDDLPSIERIYAMRKKAVGLLGNLKGVAKPIPFVEDTCVPPENLADYIREFRQLLDRHHLQYGMFGHVDAGVLHVRPALDLCDVEQVSLFKKISDQVVALTLKYGGLIWGEHGKGVRSEYSHHYFTPELWRELRKVKTLFDPQNRLNPGKICTPLGDEQPLYDILSPMRADFDRQIPIALRNHYAGAMNCNGNGLCFNFDPHSAMCPSMKVSKNRLYSPKGRAAVIREWLRLMAEQGVSSVTGDVKPALGNVRSFLLRVFYTWQKARGDYDFSHEVKMAMDTCLACKACASQCPIKIDVPRFRAEFLQLYHQRYLRPLKDHVVANVEYLAPLMAKAPRWFNAIMQHPISDILAKKWLGMVDLPRLSHPNLASRLALLPDTTFHLETLEHLSEQEKQTRVLVVQDPFTSFYDARVVADFIQLVQKLGYQPILLPFKPNGKAQHIKGFLQRFSQTALNQAQFLTRIAQLGIPMVGVESAIVLSYRDEYQQILGNTRGTFNVLTTQEWLHAHLTHIEQRLLAQSAVENSKVFAEQTWYLLPHCTESTALPNTVELWQQIFATFGQKLESLAVGCCGMAGTFGHEVQHVSMSSEIYQLSWAEKLKDKPTEFCLATGYSCRSQVKRYSHLQPKHPVSALCQLVENIL